MKFSEEQDALRTALRGFLEHHSSSAAVRAAIASEPGYDPAVWARLSGELGLTGLGIPEEYGGVGGGQVEHAAVFEEMGRALLCAPYLAGVLAAQSIQLSEDVAACKTLLPGIADGSTIASLAVCGESGSWDLDPLPLQAVAGPDGWVVSGTVSYVLDGMSANSLIAIAQTTDGPSLFVVDPVAATVRRGLSTLDLTRPLATLTFSDASAQLIGVAGGVAAWFPQLLDIGRICVAAEQVGGAQWCLDTSTSYAKLRYQFNRPIGSFQAIKHRLAEMLIEVENARSAAYFAAWALADHSPEAARAVPLTTVVCSEAYRQVAADCIQVHGGIGFTWEHDAHLYYRRAGASAMQFGDASKQWEVLATLILDPA
jgi:alkylation response protein AidB-like acyl-CoA dehydrogenase